MKKLLILFCLAFGLSLTAAAQNPCWSEVAAGLTHTLALKTDGTLWAWGDNGEGQLGFGNNDNQNTPQQVGTDNNWKSISAGYYYTLALKTDGTLWAWGDNIDGQLGLGNNDSKNTPQQVGTDNNWESIAAGSTHTLALKTDGTLWAWGENVDGQLGLGNNDITNTPQQVGTDNNWESIAPGGFHTLALKTDGTLWAWGDNRKGQLGLGNNDNQNTPQQVGTDNNWESIAAGYFHTLALKTDGTLWAWGDNIYGQLGLGNNDNQNTPQQVGTDNNWKSIAAGYFHTLALKIDGTLWAWGRNEDGQLGLGNNDSKNTPQQVGTDNNWESTAPGGFHTLALKTDGTLWAWGENDYGQLGLGNNDSKNTPQQVGGQCLAGYSCAGANDIQSLLGQAANVPQVSSLYDNTQYNSTGDPTTGFECWADGPLVSRTIWYTFMGDGNTYRLRSVQCNANPYLNDTQVAIYSGSCGSLAPVACNDDEDLSNNVFNIQVDVPTQSGVTYWMMVDGFNTDMGQFCLEVTNLQPSDACAGANDINPLFGQAQNLPQVSSLYDNTGYNNTGDPTTGFECWAESGGPLVSRTIWYTFMGDGNTYRLRSVQCNANPYLNDTQVAIYSGSCGSLAPVACNDDEDLSNNVYNIQVDVPTQSGVTYWMMVDGYDAAVGQFCLEVTNLAPSAVTEIGQTDIGVFPNPTMGIVQLTHVKADQVEVFDNMGRLVFTKSQPGTSIDISGVPAGMYFLKITEGEAMYSARVVKE